MFISVIIATRDRCDALKNCLKHMARAAENVSGECEVIVIDNGSSDGTRDVIRDFVQDNSRLFRSIYEPVPGKSNALNRAIEIASGSVLAFTDDDCYVDEAWIRSIAAEFEADGVLGALCGRVELFDPRDLPISIRTSRDRCVLNTADLALTVPMGCNMACSRAVIESVGGFDPALGPGSAAGAVAEDADFVYRVWKAGHKLVYTPGVWLRHHHGRRLAKDELALRKKYVVGRGAFYLKHLRRGDRTIAKLAYWEVRNHVRRRLTTAKEARNPKPLLKYLMEGARYGLTAKFLYGKVDGHA